MLDELVTQNMGASQFGELLEAHIAGNDDYANLAVEFIGDPAGN